MSTWSAIIAVLWHGFLSTLELVLLSAVLSLVLGTLIAIMRVSSIVALRGIAAFFVGVVRNTPLPYLLFFTVLVLPQLVTLSSSFFVLATIALVLYYAAFVCEAVRAGIGAVHSGEAEAARSLGLRRHQVLTLVVVPQALRSMVPPLVSLFIQLVRSSAVAGGFGVGELFSKMGYVIFYRGDVVIQILLITSVFYLAITIPSGYALGMLERRLRVSR